MTKGKTMQRLTKCVGKVADKCRGKVRIWYYYCLLVYKILYSIS